MSILNAITAGVIFVLRLNSLMFISNAITAGVISVLRLKTVK